MTKIDFKGIIPLEEYDGKLVSLIVKFLLKEGVYNQYVCFHARIYKLLIERWKVIDPRTYGYGKGNIDVIFNIVEKKKTVDWDVISSAWVSYLHKNYKNI